MTKTCRLRRRGLLAASLLGALPILGRAAPYAADGPARARAGALRGVLLGATVAGSRLVAVGERGHVLLSDDLSKSWRQAKAVPTRATLTCVHATDAQHLWAAGHGGIIIASSDAGETWAVAAGKAEAFDVLLAIYVDDDGRGLAVGGFGFALTTADRGKTWSATKLLDGEAGEKHLNHILVSKAGTWLIAAEGGLMLRSTDRVHWTAVATPYKGSLWAGLQLQAGVLLVGGMRGNVVRSTDDGQSWLHSAIPQAGSITAGAALPDGRAVLVGVDGTVVMADAAGSGFVLRRLEDRTALTAALALPGGALLAASTAGIRALTLPG